MMILFITIVFLTINFVPVKNQNSTIFDNRRQEKIFSIFSIIQFANEGCTSSMALSSSTGGAQFRNGTCLTSPECSSRGGSGSGTCAGGFGVCCVFMVSICGSSVNQNCSYIKNPNFPSAFTDTTACSFTINKCQADICDFRLDFEMFNTLGPADTIETNGGMCQDMLTTTVSTGQIVPVICGSNAGHHIYLDVGRVATNSATLAFTFMNMFNRFWDIKVTQIPCNADFAPRDGCLQYHTGIDGRFTTFNFAGNNQHLASQNQNICIRQERGYCCIAYSVCSDSNSMNINNGGQNDFTKAFFGTLCLKDFVNIEASSPTGSGNLQNRYCGGKLASVAMATANDVIRDCTLPFEVRYVTDNTNTNDGTSTALNRGVCLDYTQEPCQSMTNAP